MLWFALCIVAAALCVAWIEYRYPLASQPRYKFNSLIPALLRTGAVTCLGWCFVRGNRIGSHHRAHEVFHHRRVIAQGRWCHLWAYLCAFGAGLLRHGFAKVTSPTGREYLAAYWEHPEEIAARAYADANAEVYPPLGGVR
jgi:hypothetical protein